MTQREKVVLDMADGASRPGAADKRGCGCGRRMEAEKELELDFGFGIARK